MNELKKYSCVCNIRQQGTITAFEINTGEGNTYFSEIKTRAYKFFLAKGVLLRPLGNVLFVNPPFTINKKEYEYVTAAIAEFLDDLTKSS